MQLYNQYVQVDEEGFFSAGGERVQNPDLGHSLLTHLKRDERGCYVSLYEDAPVVVEAFDEILVAHEVARDETWTLTMPYDFEAVFDPQTLCLDEWDRFHGRTQNGLPFVLSPSAQDQFFDLCDEFDDDSVTIDGKRIAVGPWLQSNPQKSEAGWWDAVYVNEPVPGFDLQQPAPALPDLLNRLKLPKSRILILGAGQCNDAYFLAEQGHLVTAVDFSEQGFAEARKRHGDHPNLKMVTSDIFNLPREFDSSFDIVFEHTCYCAIDPAKRNELVKIWRRCLVETGHLMGIFYALDRPSGPPYGGSEWEVRERLKKGFQFLYWSRSHQSLANREGQEFLVYALKKSAN